MTRRTLVTNAQLLTMEDKPVAAGPHQLLIEDGRIAAIGADVGATDAQTIDAAGGIVMPGMIDTHRHVWQALLRARLSDGTLYEYMATVRYGYSPHFTAEDAELGNYAGALDALTAGVTTVVDHSHLVASPDHADALLTGLENAGIRAVFCYGLSDMPDPGIRIETKRAFTSTWRHSDAARLRRDRLSSDTGLIRFGLGGSEFLFAPLHYTATEVEVARRLDAHRYSIHVANGPFARGTRYVTRLLANGLADDRTLFVHGNVLTRRDLDRIARVGACASATPETEMQMGMGTPIWPQARVAGVPCGLGVDIVSVGSGDLFTPMRLALAAARLAANDKLGRRRVMPENLHLTAEDALRAVTIDGARAAGLDREVGSLKVGKRADLVLLRANGPNLAPHSDLARTVVMQATPADVELVMVDGRVVKRDGRLVTPGQQGLADRLNQAADRVMAATTDRALDDAHAYVRAAFPLDSVSALGARAMGKAMQVRGLDERAFKALVAHANKTRGPVAD